MAGRRWEGAKSFEQLSEAERDQVRQELGVRRSAPTLSQPKSAALTDIAGLAKTDGNVIVGNGTNWVAESGATARTSLGLGTGDTPQFTGINVGHATDTTVTRSGAGIIAVEGSNVLMASGIGTLVHAAMTQQGAIADPTGGATTDTEARAAVVSILTALRTLGLIAT